MPFIVGLSVTLMIVVWMLAMVTACMVKDIKILLGGIVLGLVAGISAGALMILVCEISIWALNYQLGG